MQYSRNPKIRRLLLFAFCCCLAAVSPKAHATTLIPTGSQHFFALEHKVAIKDLHKRATSFAAETSYTFHTKLQVNSVWHAAKEQLLQVYFTESSVSAPAKRAGQHEKRTITTIPDRPFYISLVDGQPQSVVAHSSRDQSLLNLERGIASLLQLRRVDGQESDVAGQCRVRYKVHSTTRIEKSKSDCARWHHQRLHYRTEQPLSLAQHGQEHVTYELGADGTLLHVLSQETQRVQLEAKPDVGSEISAQLSLKHLAIGAVHEVEQLPYTTLGEAVASLLEWYRVFELEADEDTAIIGAQDETLTAAFAAHTQELDVAHIGEASLALRYAQLLPLARNTHSAEFVAILQAHKALQPQLVDLLGAVQTLEAHNAINTVFKYNNSQDAELLEKYLQSLAVGTHPEAGILAQLLALLQVTADAALKDDKLRDTATQTLAALARRLPGYTQQVRDFLLAGLRTADCSASDYMPCATVYIRALQNLQDADTIDTLLEVAVQAKEARIQVAALQALKAFPAVLFTAQHRQTFARIFYQLQRKYDSTARTFALDVLLAVKPSAEQLGQLLDYLQSHDRQFELKTYVLQKLRMIAARCPRFHAMLAAALAARPKVNNYHVLGQKGLSTVLTRQLTQAPAFNESLLSVQEVYQGILKRGSVELTLQAVPAETQVFKLGLYTSGLGGLVGDGDSSDGDDVPSDDVDDTADGAVTAGMEISVQGVNLRPLVFFNGQTELMGHVWGGTASEPTPAYQATTLAQDHEQYAILASGATVYLRVLGARTVDLNGKVGFSLWNRNAQTEIQQNTGHAIVGHIDVGFTYAKLHLAYTVTHEPKLSLQANLDFYSGIKLCMQLQRPELLLNYTSTRSVTLQAVDKPYTKRISHTHSHKAPGHTLALNQKNNEMCNALAD